MGISSKWLSDFIKILSLFNTQNNRPRADQNFAPFWPTIPALSDFIKILSLFNTQPNGPWASPAISKHVGQVPYSRGFKFGEKGPIKILPHFGLQVRRCRISQNFKSFQQTT